ncbi:MAG: ATP-dependent protease ATPase subunit HslU [Spirochaetia bacterium]|nr:ATP-dependent protease ATPase subunit HslU [Spirochaetia bacterium]MBQ3713337.1 ATP-dependent protease ATPase subunit HslU [Spirochaetia bacterium]MBR0319061.1 ATP-dependent protease ATPase subunit HslU [Spirochaetia bacterium]
MLDFDKLTPKQIVEELDKYIIGQDKAKRTVAMALRNRVRRKMLPESLREEVIPKNIIMIGSTGVGKTEIARRLSKLSGAPFVKVEATKYTEVGYVGRDVESIIRDLMSVAVNMVKTEMRSTVMEDAKVRVEEQLLDLLLPGNKDEMLREKFRGKLKSGELEEHQIEIDVTKTGFQPMEIFAGTGLEDMGINFGSITGVMGGKKKKRRTTVKHAREILLEEEIDKLIDSDKVSEIAKQRTQEMGIVFIDEIDKVAGRQNTSGADVSREGVQRDILPIVEGCKVNTKYGMVDTTHILFIAAGAFHMSKPSDLIPELQGRFPLRVELEPLQAKEFEKILTQPENALIKQYKALMDTEGVNLVFTDDAVKRIAYIAQELNSGSENIGARRLHTIMELLLEEVSFAAPELKGQTITVTPQYVDDRLHGVLGDQDLARYIL